ncbi:tail fiber domain-containing protein [Stenotrophomonas maltophilia]|uniref:tail fiber domain-containing protein n=1 Tax=Stenotrophomonas maltophilia TaxID=40324 RepID=UPI0012FE08BA|nr:hypothetical protein [Stenotrophomonas maltophilia]
MPVPNSMADLATLASSNFPTGTESIGNNLDNYLRSHGAIIRSTNAVASASIASASTTDIATADGEHVQVTGSATINNLGTGFTGCYREVLFLGTATLVASIAILLPNGNITTATGDIHGYRCIAPGQWRLTAASSPNVASVRGLQAALDAKLSNSGDNTYTGTLAIDKSSPSLPSPQDSEVIALRLNQNSGSGNSEEMRFSIYRRGGGSGYETSVTRIKRFVNGFSQAYHDYYSGQPILGSRAHAWGYAATDLAWLDTSGNISFLGNITSNSDESLKENWRDVRPDLVESMAEVLSGVYDRTDIEQTQVGVSAQSLQRVLPHAVRDNGTGILGVDYGNAALVTVIEACKRILKLEAAVYGAS